MKKGASVVALMIPACTFSSAWMEPANRGFVQPGFCNAIGWRALPCSVQGVAETLILCDVSTWPPATPLPHCFLFDIISNMTTLLEQAVERLRQLPERMQNSAARALIFQLDQIEQGESA